jgi:tetratricopeptide (TPR) repeat protein/tRNA A-37 threonylcarbamoyl transferase component Bud32
MITASEDVTLSTETGNATAKVACDDTLVPTAPSHEVWPNISRLEVTERGQTNSGTALNHDETVMPSAPSQPARPAQPKEPTTIAGYEVLGMLGRGGMGVVYKARQTRLNRVVALKMMLSGMHAGEEEAARFRREAEAVARLQHPNIVQIYEIGEHESRPFFSLEFVEGGSLDKMLGGTPQSPREAARMIEQLARAIHVAHQAGILHRDLKPANVLLQRKADSRSPSSEAATGQAVPISDCTLKITDFGLAKNIDDQNCQTQSGAIMGTPSYMAPEQAAGQNKDLGPAADIYALGSMLYDFLTGRPPFKGQSVFDTLQQVQSLEPLSPVRLQPGVPRDLETICLKCLHKEPEKRYRNAELLADDVRCFLEGKPITARATGPIERGWKWARRHPAAAGLAVVSTAAVLALGAGGLLYAEQHRQRAEEALALQAVAEENAREASRQEQIAHQQRAHAEQEQRLAESNFKQARAAVDEMLSRVGQEDLANEPRMERVRHDLLQKALHFYERFVQQKSEDPEVRWEAGRAQQRVGDIQEMLGRHEPAAGAYRSAVAILEALTTEFPGQADYRQDLAAAENNLAIVLQAAGRPDGAEQAYRKALAAKAGLVADFAEVPAYRRELAGSLNNHGILLQTRNQSADAEKDYREAITLFEKLAADFPDVADYQQELARTHANLGVLLQTTARPREAEKAYRRAVLTQSKLAERFPDVANYRKEQGRGLFNLGVVLQLAGQGQKAEEAYRQALTLFERLSTEFPSVPDYRHELAVGCNNLGNLCRDLRRADEAESLWRRAAELLTRLADEVRGVPVYRQELARTQNELGIVLAGGGHWREAESAWQVAVKLQSTLAGEFPREPSYRQELARSQGNLGILMAQRQRLGEAEECYLKATRLLEELAREFPKVAAYADELTRNRTTLANLLAAAGRTQDAEKIRQTLRQTAK